MNNSNSVISIRSSHNSLKPHPIYIEPWGEDYWLFPGDKFEISAIGNKSSPDFSIVENADSTQIYIEGDCKDFSVLHGEKNIECGYQRAKLAGQIEHTFTIIGRGVVITSKERWLLDLKVKDELRLILPNSVTLAAPIISFEHINTGSEVRRGNPFGIFLGELKLDATEIKPSTLVYRLESS